MDLGTFVPMEGQQGDNFPARDNVDKPLVVWVREYKTGIRTKFNSNPKESNYKPEGGDGVLIDVADLTTNIVYIDALWMNGAVCDQMAPNVGTIMAIKLQWTAPKGAGQNFIAPVPLEGQELAYASQWAATNDGRFEWERSQRELARKSAGPVAPAPPAAPAPPPAPTAPVFQPPAAPTAPQPPAAGQQWTPPAAAAAPQPPAPVAPAQPAAGSPQWGPPPYPPAAPGPAVTAAPVPTQGYAPPGPPAGMIGPDGQPVSAETWALLQQLQQQQGG